MPHNPDHDPTSIESALQGATVGPDERTWFQRMQDDVREGVEGNPIFEALNAVSGLVSDSPAGALGAFAPAPAAPASGAARGLAARAGQSAGRARPMEEILRNPQFRRKVFREVGSEGAGRVRKYIGSGKAPEEALNLAKKELRAKRLHDAIETFEKTGRIILGGGGRKPTHADIVKDVGGGALAGEFAWIRDKYEDLR